MKHLFAVIAFMLACCYSLFGQPCTFNNGADKYCIGDIRIVYDVNKFVVSGFEVNPTYQLPPGEKEPAIVIFIETGDGNFISKELKPSETGVINIPYEYAAYNTGFNFIAEATKNYDGGGPRRKILAQQTATQTQPTDGPVPATEAFTSFTVRSFPNDIVMNDTITLAVMTAGNQSAYYFFQYNTLLVEEVIYGSNVNPISSSHTSGYSIQKFSISGYGGPAGPKNTFIRIRPRASTVASIPMGTDAPPFYFTASSKLGSSLLSSTTLKVLASHDPNNLEVAFCDFCPERNCRRMSRRETRNRPITFHYTVNFENAGLNDETGVEVKLYCMKQNLKEEVTISHPVYAGAPYPGTYPATKSLHSDPAREGLYGQEPVGTVIQPFAGVLSGTSFLPYGHPSTQGRVSFTIEGKEKFKDLSPGDVVKVWAEIHFVNARETIKTNEISISRKDFRKYYNRRCICQRTFFLFRWACRLFKGI